VETCRVKYGVADVVQNLEGGVEDYEENRPTKEVVEGVYGSLEETQSVLSFLQIEKEWVVH
jgi:hypothetical protein